MRPARLKPEQITLDSASYGDLTGNDPSRIRDVKSKVNKALRVGDGSFTVASLADGDDPALGFVKTLKISYRINGKPATSLSKDPDIVDLLEME